MNEAQINATTNPAAGLTQAAEREDRRVLRLVLFDALASEAMGTLTTGVFLVGLDRKSTRLNSSHITPSRMPSSA